MVQEEYGFLPPAWLLRLLQHPMLVVKDEFALYELICHYIKDHSEIEENQIAEMMGTVRFVWMSIDQLKEVEENPAVPRHLLIEAFMERLRRIEGNQTPQKHEDNPRLLPRPPQSYTYEYPPISALNEGEPLPHGIVYHIATNGGQEPWHNPSLSGRITILTSSIERGVTHDLVGLSSSDLWTKDIPSSWFTLDLGQSRSVAPTAYTLRHGMNFKADSLRTWELQGSTGDNWVCLRRHTNDTALNGRYSVNTWIITLNSNPLQHSNSNPNPNSNITNSNNNTQQQQQQQQQTAFRYFRILQTGRNSNNRNFLVLCGFEIYGELFERS